MSHRIRAIARSTLCSLPLWMTGVQAVAQSRSLSDALTQLCTKDAECDDGVFCNGRETSDLGNGQCQSRPPVLHAANVDAIAPGSEESDKIPLCIFAGRG